MMHSMLSSLNNYLVNLSKLEQIGVIRTANNPIGDYGEYYVATKYGLKLGVNSQRDYDATDKKNKKYQIKARLIKDKN